MNEAVGTVAAAMLTAPVRHQLDTSVSEVRDFFTDEHVHCALIVDPAGYLAAVVEREDLAGRQILEAAAAPLGRLAGRTVLADARLALVQRSMTAAGRRRAAVVQHDGTLLGLLCLKASQTGFCSEHDVQARTRARSGLR